jgi:GTP-binding protein
LSRPSTPKDQERLHVDFLTSAPDLRRAPPADCPEVALAGRSNAGKSSVLNRLTGSRHTARVSKTPGRTRLLNFFSVRGGGRLVDLPGYGYARAEREAQAEWQRMVNDYLAHRTCLVGLVLVMDIRHPLQPFDLELIEWARAASLPLVALLNKADKLGFGARQQALMRVRKRLAGDPRIEVMVFSALDGLNAGALIAVLRRWLRHPENVSSPA